MIQYFNEALVLTSKNPEGFVNFGFEAGDNSTWIIPRQDTTLDDYTIFVNGLDLNGGFDPSALVYEPSIGYALEVNADADPSIASFVISSNMLTDFDYNLQFDIYTVADISAGTSIDSTVDISIFNRHNIIAEVELNNFETTNIQTEGDTSYLLLRTNPKFSGNIKLIADSSNHLYLDTFKVSDILSNKKYRRQIISGNSYLSGDIRRVFSDLPEGELYRLDDENILDIKLPETELFDQYELNYSYGARLFKDELYVEDYAMLAPIWINKDIPSYFAVFRVDGVYNAETYTGESLANIANDYITEGQLVSTWSLKEKSPLGSYMRNHVEELLQFRAPVFLSLTDPDIADFDPNTWYGIAVDKGIITGRSEVPYFFDQKARNFTDMNAFISEGFERNNLLLPNIVNMEYVFNDEDVSLYSMHRYYGLYLTENELYRIAYYADTSSGNISIISLDGRDSSTFFNSNIFDSSGNVSTNYENRIFGLDDVLSFKRIFNNGEADGTDYSKVSDWLNKPGQNLFTATVQQREFNDFISFKIKTLLEPGEHLRLIDASSANIWEAYGTNTDILNAGEALTYASHTEPSIGYHDLYRVTFSTKGDISDQILAIQKAFDVFLDYEGTPFTTGIRREDSLSLIINDLTEGDFKFQRLTSNIVNDTNDPSSAFNAFAQPGDIEFFGRLTPIESDIERVTYDSIYGPIGFELFGDRQSIMLNLIDPSNYYIYSFDASFGYEFEDNVLYLSEDDLWYRLVLYNDVSTGVNIYSYSYVDDPVELDLNMVVMTTHPIKLLNENQWNAYGVYPLSISLMGINPVKDIDYTVYDANLGAESEYWYAREDDPSTYQHIIELGESLLINSRGSFEIESGDGSIYIDGDVSTYSDGFNFNTFFGDASIIATSSKTTVTYNTSLDGSAVFTSYIPGSSEEDINDYYEDASTKEILKYSLTVPTVSKWVGLGSDCRGNPLRLILNGEIFDSSTNFIPFDGAFENEITFPSYKYLDNGQTAWQSYVYFDINDVVTDSSLSKTLKEFMFDNPTIDVFSKLLYTNKNVSGTYVRSSIIYYNQYKDTIEGIVNGLNFSIGVSADARSVLNAKDWDRYRFSFISTPSRNSTSNSPIEIIINENTETLLIIWYQGNQLLNYTYRNSTALGANNLLTNDDSDNKWENFVDDASHSYIKAPYYVYTSSLVTRALNVYGISTTGYPDTINTPYAQLNNNLADNINSIFNAYKYNIVNLSNLFLFDSQYNTFDQYVSYSYIGSSSSINPNVINKSWQYLTNINYYADKTTELDDLTYILGVNNIDYSILRGTDLISNNDFSSPPLVVSLINPREYTPTGSSNGIYTYLGWYRPKFNNILNFNSNEDDDLINIVDKDFTLGNTYFRSYDNIPQFWYNKIVATITNNDVSTADAIKFSEFNTFKSLWDGEYFVLSGGITDTLVDGFNSTLELPAFFGSKLIKLPNELGLEDWDFTTATSSISRNFHTLSFNLTRNIINTFKENDDFLENWSGLSTTDNVIDGYIKNTIVNYYNITRPKIEVNIYTKPFDGERLYFTLDDTFTKSESKNVEGILNFVNGDYIYNIQTNLLPNLSYYISFILVEK